LKIRELALFQQIDDVWKLQLNGVGCQLLLGLWLGAGWLTWIAHCHRLGGHGPIEGQNHQELILPMKVMNRLIHFEFASAYSATWWATGQVSKQDQ
jgi:hypothetical protein